MCIYMKGIKLSRPSGAGLLNCSGTQKPKISQSIQPMRGKLVDTAKRLSRTSNIGLIGLLGCMPIPTVINTGNTGNRIAVNTAIGIIGKSIDMVEARK